VAFGGGGPSVREKPLVREKALLRTEAVHRFAHRRGAAALVDRSRTKNA